jgi:hypothetical protein
MPDKRIQTESEPGEDPQMAAAADAALRSLDAAGITVQDLLDELPAARAEVLRRAYSPAFLQDLDRQFRAVQRSVAARQVDEG